MSVAWIVALREEARPLCALMHLRAQPGPGPFTLYRSEEAWLVQSGVGRVNAAAAVAWLAGVTAARPPAVWINAGVAGHPGLAPGELRVASTIREPGGGRRWFPPQSLLQGLPGCALISVDQPETRFDENALYDMEAAGFYALAVRCASAELVHSLKVVSDNRATPAAQLTGTRIEALMRARAGDFAALGRRLAAAADALPGVAPDPIMEMLLARAHFSLTQRRRLAELLRRHRALAPRREVLDATLLSMAGAGALLRELERRVAGLPIAFPPP